MTFVIIKCMIGNSKITAVGADGMRVSISDGPGITPEMAARKWVDRYCDGIRTIHRAESAPGLGFWFVVEG